MVPDITQHRTREGRVDCSVARCVVGWSIADHLHTELIVDALEMACLGRGTRGGETAATISTPSTAPWPFGRRLCRAGLLGARWAASGTASMTLLR